MGYPDIDDHILSAIFRDPKVQEILEWLRGVFLAAGTRLSNRDLFGAPPVPETAKITFFMSYGALRARIVLPDEYMARLGSNVYDINLGRDTDPIHVALLKHLLHDLFYEVEYANDWRDCEANLTHEPWKSPVICEQVDGVWMCAVCQKEKEKKPEAGTIYVIGSAEVGYVLLSEEERPRFVTYSAKHLPFEAGLLHRIIADDRRACQQAFSSAFQDQHAHNDWYRLSEADLARLRTVARFGEGAFLDRDDQPVALRGA